MGIPMDHLDGHRYRPAKPLPYELSQHCNIYFEEKLYNLGLTLLLNLLTAGTLCGPNPATAFVPSAAHLALAATIIVHPVFTTRAKSPEDGKAASTALQLLRAAHKLVGPVNARFDQAFTITHFQSSRHRGRNYGSSLATQEAAVSDPMAGNLDPETLNFEMARSESVWSRAEDFWQAVGWAFNCSTLYPRRWERWRLWLEFMCDVLEDDWEVRMEAVKAQGHGEDSAAAREAMKQSLAWKYISTTSGLSETKRRMLRAIFADGQAESMLLFKEVFRNELKEPSDKTEKKKEQVALNLDENLFGDYDEDSDEKSSSASGDEQNAPTTRTRQSRTGRKYAQNPSPSAGSPNAPQGRFNEAALASALGPLSAVRLRQRLLQLLSAVSTILPDDFVPTMDLYHLFVQFVRPLPFPAFQLITSSSNVDGLTAVPRMTLCEMLLCSLLERPETSDDSFNEDDDEEGMTQDKFEERYAPFTARKRNRDLVGGGRESKSSTASSTFSNNSGGSAVAIDNAKVSVLIETALRLLATQGMLEPSLALEHAVLQGIEARAEMAKKGSGSTSGLASGSRKRKGDGSGRQRAEDMGLIWLKESSERLKCMLELIFSGQR